MSRFASIALLSLLGLAPISCCGSFEKALMGTPVVVVPVQANGGPSRVPATLPAGKTLLVGLRYDAQHEGDFETRQDIVLWSRGSKVLSKSCTQRHVTGKKARRSRSTDVLYPTSCPIEVPTAGVDEVEVLFRATPPTAITFSRLEVGLYQD